MRKWWTLLLLFGLPACSDGSSPPVDAAAYADAYADGGPTFGRDAAAADAAPPFSDGGVAPPPSEYDLGGLGPDGAFDACFDGLDNDGDGSLDCRDPSCQTNISSCCVGAPGASCCREAAPALLPLGACSAGPLRACVDAMDLSIFGSPEPSVSVYAVDEGPSFVPGGDLTDSSAWFTRGFDARRGAVRVNATIETPTDPPEGGRVETVGVGLVAQDLGGAARITPLAAVLSSRNRQQALFVVAGEVVAERPIEGSMSYTLELDTDGIVRLSADAWPPIEASVRVDGPVRAIAYGRTANPLATAPPPTRLTSMAVVQTECDMPTALERSSGTAVPDPLGVSPSWADAHASIERPHVLRFDDGGGERVRMVLLVDGEVHLAEPGPSGFELLTTPGDPALPAPIESWARRVDHPRLRWDTIAGALELWFTGYDANGTGTVGRATWNESAGRFLVVGPVDGLRGSAAMAYSAATPFVLGGRLHAAVRVDTAAGHQISLYDLASGAARLTRVLREPRGDDLFALDRDEVDSPAVLVLNGLVRLYYSGRRGTRWSLGLLVMEPATTPARWIEPLDGPVLVGADGGAAFDGLGVRDAAFDVVGEEVRLYYTGDDGTRTRIGQAFGFVPPPT